MSEKKRKQKRADSSRFINRELSWLAFNERVLAEAESPDNPPLERLKFLAITASNLDEFFMVRVGGLRMLAARGVRGRDPAGLTPREQLQEIARRVQALVRAQHACYVGQIAPALNAHGIAAVREDDLSAEDIEHLQKVFEQELLPLLTPRSVPPDEPFPLLPGLTIHLGARLKRPASEGGMEWLGFVALPRGVPRFIPLPERKGFAYVAAEDILAMFVERLFPGLDILETFFFRVTRNADLEVREDLAAICWPR